MLIPILIFLLFSSSSQIEYRKAFTSTAHTPQVYTTSFFKDQKRMITGGADMKVKIWSLTTFTVLHELTFAGQVFNVALHPTDNRIFVLVGDGNIFVYHQTTYTQLHTFAYPGVDSTNYPNYLVFNTVGNRFMVAGYDGTGSIPKIHFYDSTSYAFIKSVTSGFPADDQIITLSINAACTHIVAANKDTNGGGVFKTQVYAISNDALLSSFTDHTNVIKWALFDNTANYYCSTSADQTVKCYNFDSANNIYTSMVSWSTTGFSGASYPYCLNFGIAGFIIVTVGPSFVFYNMTGGGSGPTPDLSYTDSQDIFVFDSTPDMTYFVSGMRNGVVSVWKQVVPPADTTTPTKESVNIGLIVGIVVGVVALITLIAILIYCCKWGALSRRKLKKGQFQASDNLNFMKGQIIDERMNQIDDQFIIIQGDSSQSDSSSQPDYDQLIAHGTVIVIKDQQKKRRYLKKLKKKKKKNRKQKKLKTNKQQIQIKQQDKSKSSIAESQFNIEGNIIIIRDQNHAIKKKKGNISQTSSDPDYQQLMAEGNVIIIKDQDIKKKLVNNLKKNNKGNMNNEQLNQLLIQGNIIIIKGDNEQQKLLKELKKQKDIQKIKHDQIMANGDVIVIKDNQKKKVFVQDLKKQILQKNINNFKTDDIKQLQIAEQIIVIRGDDDEDEDQMTYEQLTAEGTVIIIKDDDIKKQYLKHKMQSRDNNGKSNNNKKSVNQQDSQPDYQTLMAQQCIIVIKDQDDKRDYVDFVKQRKIVIKQQKTNPKPIINQVPVRMKLGAVKPPKNTNEKSQQVNNQDPYNQMEATGGTIIIKESGPEEANFQINSSQIPSPRQVSGRVLSKGGAINIGK